MTVKKRGKRPRKDPVREDFGPGAEEGAAPAERPFGAIPCAGEGCFLKPLADLFSRFTLRVVRGHGFSLGRAAFSGIELMKALRDYLDEEIALAERATSPGAAPRVTKIPVE